MGLFEGFTKEEVEMLQSGVLFLAIHHEEQRKEFARNAADFPKKVRAQCEAVSKYHRDCLYDIGELAAKVGLRNGWPRPAKE